MTHEPHARTPRIVIATGNPHKVAELRAILAAQGVDADSLADLPDPAHEPVEHGTTFEQNATIKALAYAAQTGRFCLADDSGLEIDALHARPGVISSHYCTDGVETGLSRAERDRLNNDRVLRELAGVPPERRTARFVCVMALAGPAAQEGMPSPPAILRLSRGSFEGRIGLPGDVPRGTHGFGYDPLFLVAPDFRVTSAELDPETKNSLSHRARAAHAMAAQIRPLLVLPPR